MTANKRFKRLVRARARRTGERYSTARHWLLAQRESGGTTVPEQPVRVELESIKEQVSGEYAGMPVVFLREVGGPRFLTIVMGRPEGMAIASALQGQTQPRPLTHDALRQAVVALGGHVDHIVIRGQDTGSDERPSKIFLAELAVVRGAETIHLDFRPSDALALAVRQQPMPAIFVDPPLLEPGEPRTEQT